MHEGHVVRSTAPAEVGALKAEGASGAGAERARMPGPARAAFPPPRSNVTTTEVRA